MKFKGSVKRERHRLRDELRSNTQTEERNEKSRKLRGKC